MALIGRMEINFVPFVWKKKTKLNFWAGPQLRLGAIKALEEVNFYFQPPQLKGTLIGPLIFA